MTLQWVNDIVASQTSTVQEHNAILEKETEKAVIEGQRKTDELRM